MSFRDALAKAYALGQLWAEHDRAGREDMAFEVSQRLERLQAQYDTPPVHWVCGPGDD